MVFELNQLYFKVLTRHHISDLCYGVRGKRKYDRGKYFVENVNQYY